MLFRDLCGLRMFIVLRGSGVCKYDALVVFGLDLLLLVVSSVLRRLSVWDFVTIGMVGFG